MVPNSVSRLLISVSAVPTLALIPETVVVILVSAVLRLLISVSAVSSLKSKSAISVVWVLIPVVCPAVKVSNAVARPSISTNLVATPVN